MNISALSSQTKHEFLNKKNTYKKVQEKIPVDILKKMDAYWRAANYLSVGQIYLYDNPLLKEHPGKTLFTYI